MGTFGIVLEEANQDTSGFVGGEIGELDQGSYPGDDTYEFDVDFDEDGSPFVLTGSFGLEPGSDSAGNDYSYIEPDWGELVGNTDGTFTYTLEVDDLPSDFEPGDSTSFFVTLDGLSASDDYDPFFIYPDDPGTDYDTDEIVINVISCFAKGTLIATPEGERNVETLKVGDMVTTEDGRAIAVRWIGVKVADPMFNPADRLEPVLIRAGALGENTPHKDLVVTADHGMIVDGHVVDAAVLVGAPGIEFLPWKQLKQTITYYHIETAGHEIIYANSAAAETFIDYTGRRMFDNYAEFVTLYGEENTIPEMELPRISALRQMPATLRARFGLTEETVTFNILAA